MGSIGRIEGSCTVLISCMCGALIGSGFSEELPSGNIHNVDGCLIVDEVSAGGSATCGKYLNYNEPQELIQNCFHEFKEKYNIQYNREIEFDYDSPLSLGLSQSFLGDSFIIPKNNTYSALSGKYISEERHLEILTQERKISHEEGYKVGFKAGLKSALTAPVIGDKSTYTRYIDDYKQTEAVIKKNEEYWADGIDPDD